MSNAHPRRRLDQALVDGGLVPSRSRAQALILAGKVRVNGDPVTAAAAPVRSEDRLELVGGEQPVGRGAHKLRAALDTFGLQAQGRVCADAGASTGGFTEVLLEAGATRVYAIDVGYGQLAWKLRIDPRVVVMERTNARLLKSLPEPVQAVSLDLSFISLRLVLPSVRSWLAPDGWVVALFKPQFEVGRGQVGSGGVVRDQELVEAAASGFEQWCLESGWQVAGRVDSPVTGQKGNRELLYHLRIET